MDNLADRSPRGRGGVDPRWKLGGAAALVVLALGILYAVEPASSGLFPPCPVNKLTGLHCPGCGTLRGLHRLLHGDLYGAFRFNPLMVLSLPFVAYGTVSWVVAILTEGRRAGPRIPAAWIWTLLVVVLLYAVLRNLPSYPFDLLAPHPAPGG